MSPHPNTHRTIREEAEFLARAIHEDLLKTTDETAKTIEAAIRRYAKPRYVSSLPAKAKKDPDTRIRPFLDWFQQQYPQYRAGATYLVNWAKDSTHVRTMLQTATPEDLMDCARILLSPKTDDAFIQQSDRGIGILFVKFNWLNGKRAEWIARRTQPERYARL